MLEHVRGARRLTSTSDARRFLCPCDDEVGYLIAPFEMVLHVGVSGMRRADRVMRLAVFAKYASVGVWLEAGQLFCRSGSSTV
jgi:hypothetical protein